MDRAEKCFFCGSKDPEADLVAWFVQDERRLTHTDCWLAARRSTRASGGDRMPSEADAVPHQALRKTLDDIRRELEAEYPSTPEDRADEPEPAPVHIPMPPYLNGDDRAVDRRRSASRHRRKRRHGVAVAVGCVAAPVLVLGIFLWVNRDVIGPGAVASAPETSPAAGVHAGVDRGSPPTSSASRVVEQRGAEPRGAPPVAVAAPASSPGVEEQLKALNAELRAIAAKLERSESRMLGVEARVKGVESSMRRLGDEVATAAAKRPVERAPAPARTARKPARPSPPVPVAPPVAVAPRVPIAPPAPVAPPGSAPRAVTAEYSERWIPSEPSRPGSLRRREMRPLVEEVAPQTRSTVPEPRRESTRSLEGAAPASDASPSRTASAPSDSASPSGAPPTLRDKVRDDWRAIMRGFASAGEDLKETVSGLARKVRGD